MDPDLRESNPLGSPSQRNRPQPMDRATCSTDFSMTLPETPGTQEPDNGGSFMNHFMSLDETGMRQEEFGFLGRFDVPDLASWFPDLPDLTS